MKAEEARAALYAERDQLIAEQLRAKFKYGRLGSGRWGDVSKNPPLTEDQIRQSAEAEARHAAARASRHAQLDYMIEQQRQQHVAAALEAIVGSEEDRFKAAASKIEDSAHRAIEEQDRQACEVGGIG
jgi:hypothetical protein